MANKNRKSLIPKPTVSRMPHYRRALEFLSASGIDVISSHDLAREAEVTPSQLRKDLAYFGTFGTAGIGYDVRELLTRLDDILGTANKRPVLLVGVGNLGRAFLNHSPISRSGFEIVASTDISSKKVGRVIGGVRCYANEEIEAIVKEREISIAILTVSADSAIKTAEFLTSIGIRAILNFTPVRLRVKKSILVEQVDFGLTLQKVAFYLEPLEENK